MNTWENIEVHEELVILVIYTAFCSTKADENPSLSDWHLI